MKKLILGLLLATAACTPPATVSTIPPAPLANTTIDDTALTTAWRAFDAFLDGIDALQRNGAIKAGTPKALRLSQGIRSLEAFLNAAEDAAKVGNSASYKEALTAAQATIADLRLALRSQ